MPARDGTGPMGQGPLTGRGFGPCGRGYGRGCRWGAGYGRGYGWRAGGGVQEYGPSSRGYAPAPPSEEDEIRFLEEELRQIDAEKKDIEKRLSELEGRKKKG